MTNDHLRGPWQAVLSYRGEPLPDIAALNGEDGADFSICRGTAIPVDLGGGLLDWPRSFSGDDVIELWEDVEYDEAKIRWVQVQAMVAGLNAAGTA
ncbi:hypothetical protein ACWT_5680 [Actinoplanes sp. SE50]|uniref:hypothetical protein n=1 Tax=unclassified Actinoplanes TaxID=2626549 RepID=UPI00023ED2CF|nr:MULTISPECIES: hypothetical protein [unclassified Actinoplanes]AEV86697.1 hypothetical protein ACPL_5810 [Actinoplanes sp. SE50/110]ATO85095.1 hypothetical protein ACWT_5680 [Actinoplanes sp. SE50]SLM02506.1 hypothetical protein ACSP50_5756 [Actinoplanes sp. SE50/110]